MDWDFFLVPDEAVWALGIFGVLRQIVTEASPHAFGFSLLGALIAGSIVWLIGVLGRWWFRKEAMGFGDVKIASAVGTHLGLAWTALLSFFLLSVFIGAAMGVLLAIRRERLSKPFGLTAVVEWLKGVRQALKEYMPFGPAMTVAATVMLFYPTEITDFILRLYGAT